MVGFIDEHRDAHGVEPICRVLPIAPLTYFEQQARRADPCRLPPRLLRDAELREEIERVWLQLKREGFVVARCTVERKRTFSAHLRISVRRALVPVHN